MDWKRDKNLTQFFLHRISHSHSLFSFLFDWWFSPCLSLCLQQSFLLSSRWSSDDLARKDIMTAWKESRTQLMNMSEKWVDGGLILQQQQEKRVGVKSHSLTNKETGKQGDRRQGDRESCRETEKKQEGSPVTTRFGNRMHYVNITFPFFPQEKTRHTSQATHMKKDDGMKVATKKTDKWLESKVKSLLKNKKRLKNSQGVNVDRDGIYT